MSPVELADPSPSVVPDRVSVLSYSPHGASLQMPGGMQACSSLLRQAIPYGGKPEAPLRSFFPVLFLAVPLIEIALFVTIGSAIGVLATIAIVLVTAVIGTTLLRMQGFALIGRIRARLDAGELPGRDLADGAMLLVAGLLLLTPGFFTDTIGFLLFVPAVRARIFRFVAARTDFRVVTPARPRGNAGDGPVIDLDPDDVSPGPRRPDSPWNSR